jgi:hypothetical protein
MCSLSEFRIVYHTRRIFNSPLADSCGNFFDSHISPVAYKRFCRRSRPIKAAGLLWRKTSCRNMSFESYHTGNGVRCVQASGLEIRNHQVIEKTYHSSWSSTVIAELKLDLYLKSFIRDAIGICFWCHPLEPTYMASLMCKNYGISAPEDSGENWTIVQKGAVPQAYSDSRK